MFDDYRLVNIGSDEFLDRNEDNFLPEADFTFDEEGNMVDLGEQRSALKARSDAMQMQQSDAGQVPDFQGNDQAELYPEDDVSVSKVSPYRPN